MSGAARAMPPAPAARTWLDEGVLVAGSYRVEHLVGGGSTGEVWAAVDTATGARVALKVLVPGLAADHELAERFRREAYFLARTASEHVAVIHDFVCDEAIGMVLVMELVEGESLAARLDRGKLPVEEAIALGIDLLAGVEVLHARRVVHRDLKPGNVILRPSSDGRARPVICDFGLSRLAPVGPDESRSAPSLTALTRGDMAMGTARYMAPEQVLNARQATAQSDLYAVGAILQRAVTGSPPFGDLPSSGEVAHAKVRGEAPRMASGRTDPTALGLEEVVARAVRRRPADRYPDATSMRADLLRLAGLAPAAGPEEETRRMPAPEVAPAEEPRARTSRSPLAAAAVLAVVFAAGVATGRVWPPAETRVDARAPALVAPAIEPPAVIALAELPPSAAEPVPTPVTSLDPVPAPASAEPDVVVAAPPRAAPPVRAIPAPRAAPRVVPPPADDNPY